MKTTHLVDLDLPRPVVGAEGGGARFFVKEVPNFPMHLLGTDSSNAISILLRSTDSGVRAPLKLNALDVRYALPCQVLLPGRAEERAVFTVVRCTSDNPLIKQYFLHLMEKLIAIVGEVPSIATIDDVIAQFALIFQQVNAPVRTTASGLFGELLLISDAAEASAAVAAWHSGVDDDYDFATPSVRLEVKSTGTRSRSHIFSFRQCTPPENCVAVLVSIFVEESVGGVSIFELINTITARLQNDARSIVKVQKIVAETLGSTILDALNMRFDSALARQSLVFYDLRVIPAIRPPIPTEVSQVRFRSDLVNVPTLAPRDLLAQGSELAAIIPPLE